MKVNAKNAMMGLLMLTGIIGTTMACNQQENNNVENTTENVTKVDSALKAESDSATASFKAKQAIQQEAESLLKEIEKLRAQQAMPQEMDSILRGFEKSVQQDTTYSLLMKELKKSKAQQAMPQEIDSILKVIVKNSENIKNVESL